MPKSRSRKKVRLRRKPVQLRKETIYLNETQKVFQRIRELMTEHELGDCELEYFDKKDIDSLMKQMFRPRSLKLTQGFLQLKERKRINQYIEESINKPAIDGYSYVETMLMLAYWNVVVVSENMPELEDDGVPVEDVYDKEVLKFAEEHIENPQEHILKIFYIAFLNISKELSQMHKYILLVLPNFDLDKVYYAQLIPEIEITRVEKAYVKFDNKRRPVFRAYSLTSVNYGDNKVFAESINMHGFDNNAYEIYEVYWQSHAFARLKQRLDCFEDYVHNYIFFDSVAKMEEFVVHNNRLLYPVTIKGIKVGYFVCKFFENKLVFSTFLFLTHNSTPEGDKLKQISGLGRYDISYWKIDRLSSLVNLDVDKYEILVDMFTEAGITDLHTLRDKDLKLKDFQDKPDAFMGLTQFISKGRNELAETEVEEMVY